MRLPSTSHEVVRGFDSRGFVMQAAPSESAPSNPTAPVANLSALRAGVRAAGKPACHCSWSPLRGCDVTWNACGHGYHPQCTTRREGMSMVCDCSCD